jgi:hypothetical protein
MNNWVLRHPCDHVSTKSLPGDKHFSALQDEKDFGFPLSGM